MRSNDQLCPRGVMDLEGFADVSATVFDNTVLSFPCILSDFSLDTV